MKEVTVHGSHGDYKAKRWFKLEDVVYGNEFSDVTQKNWGQIEIASQNIFGKRLNKESLARLGGAFGNEKVSIETIGKDVIKVTVEGENHTSVRKIKKDSKNKIHILLNKTRGIRAVGEKRVVDVKAAKNRGIAVNSVYTIIKEAQKLGVEYLKGDFIRTGKGHDGYFKYARLGFDGFIDHKKYGTRTVQAYIKEHDLETWRREGSRFIGVLSIQNENDLEIFNRYFLSLIS